MNDFDDPKDEFFTNCFTGKKTLIKTATILNDYHDFFSGAKIPMDMIPLFNKKDSIEIFTSFHKLNIDNVCRIIRDKISLNIYKINNLKTDIGIKYIFDKNNIIKDINTLTRYLNSVKCGGNIQFTIPKEILDQVKKIR